MLQAQQRRGNGSIIFPGLRRDVFAPPQRTASCLPPPAASAGTYADRVQKQVDIAKRNSVWRREYMNWEMTLSVERDKGRYEGEMLNSIRLILSKLSKGKTEEVIADEIEKDVTFVHLINSLSVTMDSPTPEAVFNAYKTLDTDGKFDTPERLPAD